MSKRLRCSHCGHVISEKKAVEIAMNAAKKEIDSRKGRAPRVSRMRRVYR